MASELPHETLEPLEPKPIDPTPLKSNLDLINECDNFPYHETQPLLHTRLTSHYYTFRIPCCPSPLGFVLPHVAAILENTPGWELDHTLRTLTLVDGEDEEGRSAAMARTCEAMRRTGYFEVLKGWRDELYPVYGEVVEEGEDGEAVAGEEEDEEEDEEDAEEDEEERLERQALRARTRNTQLLCTVERAASALFGVVTYGCHMTAYTYSDLPLSSSSASTTSTATAPIPAPTLKIWVPRRSPTKQTYPSLLDNTVAGGIAVHESPFASLVREAAEEASLPAELVKRKAKAAGTVSYFHIRDERAGGEVGLLMPECQFVWDLDLSGEEGAVGDGEGGADGDADADAEEKTSEIRPRPGDDEVAGFELMGVDEVTDAMARGGFKPNCALVLLDFLVRHGVLTVETEGRREYAEIVARLHRRFGFPMG